MAQILHALTAGRNQRAFAPRPAAALTERAGLLQNPQP